MAITDCYTVLNADVKGFVDINDENKSSCIAFRGTTFFIIGETDKLYEIRFKDIKSGTIPKDFSTVTNHDIYQISKEKMHRDCFDIIVGFRVARWIEAQQFP